MNKIRYFCVVLYAGWFLAYAPLTQADSSMQPNNNVTITSTTMVPPPLSYGEKLAHKDLNAWANLTTGSLEIPKSIISTINQSNFFYGLVGGFFKGIVNMLGRTGCGIADLITFPIPTQPMISPAYIWDDFDKETTYGPVIRLDKDAK